MVGFQVVLFIICLLVVAFLDYKKREKIRVFLRTKKEKLSYIDEQLKDFTISQKYVSDNLDSAIHLDEVNKKVCIVHTGLTDKVILEYKDILESGILEDGQTLTRTSRSSQVGGALLGGVLLGGVGAVIGGLSGQQTSAQEVTSVALKIIVNDTNKPLHIINFLNVTSGISKDSQLYKDAINKATHWHSLISVLIRQADEIDKKEQVKITSISSQSVADELRKLSDLLNEGILSEAEYQQQKEILLNL